MIPCNLRGSRYIHSTNPKGDIMKYLRKYLLNTFMDESEATKYPNSVSVLYYANGKFIFGEIYKQSISLKSLKGSIAYIKGLIGDAAEAIIKVNH